MNKVVLELRDAFIIQRNLQEVLGMVNLKVREGEFTYLVGETGTGKSSILRTLYGDLPLHEGFGEVCGFKLNGLPRKKLPLVRRKIGMVFQSFVLLQDRNVYENMLFVLRATDWKDKAEIDDRIYQVLDWVGLNKVKEKMPHQLSGGEQQRLAIARAMLNNPDVILADEPTGNLDPKVSDQVLELLHILSEQGTAIIMATHDYRLINKYPGTVYKIENGVVDQTAMFS
jgi:cell division transport system ATP-binding protein